MGLPPRDPRSTLHHHPTQPTRPELNTVHVWPVAPTPWQLSVGPLGQGRDWPQPASSWTRTAAILLAHPALRLLRPRAERRSPREPGPPSRGCRAGSRPCLGPVPDSRPGAGCLSPGCAHAPPQRFSLLREEGQIISSCSAL